MFAVTAVGAEELDQPIAFRDALLQRVARQFDAGRDVLAVESSACQCAVGGGLAIVAFEGGAGISVDIGGRGGLFQLSFRERKGVFVGGGLYPGSKNGGDQGEGKKSEEVFRLHPGGVDLGSRPASGGGSGQSRSVGVGWGEWAGWDALCVCRGRRVISCTIVVPSLLDPSLLPTTARPRPDLPSLRIGCPSGSERCIPSSPSLIAAKTSNPPEP
ncbi:hypothetical protein KC354_g61 [Hortaea werneckii]|nr:hypothetical protein KC354_g61 [Hortaea werneckii]